MDIIYTGEDIELKFTYSNANSDVVDLDNVEEIIVAIIINNSEKLRYSKTSLENTEPIDIDDPTTGEFYVRIPRSVTKDFPEGKMEYEAKFREMVDGFDDDFSSVMRETIYQVKDGKTKNYV